MLDQAIRWCWETRLEGTCVHTVYRRAAGLKGGLLLALERVERTPVLCLGEVGADEAIPREMPGS